MPEPDFSFGLAFFPILARRWTNARGLLVAAASAIICLHNHPSGDPGASEADIKVTRDLIRAGAILKIEILDHIIVGHRDAQRSFQSLKELGYFAAI